MGKRILSIIILVVTALFVFLFAKSNNLLTAQGLIDFSPENTLLALLFFAILYAIKPITIFMPIMAIQVAAGIIFDPIIAILMTFIGLFISTTIAYFYGYHIGKDAVEQLIQKYSKNPSFKENESKHHVMSLLMFRFIGFIPMDLIGMLYGSRKMIFYKYSIASVLGLIPANLISTFIGISASSLSPKIFLVSLGSKAVLVFITLVVYKKRLSS